MSTKKNATKTTKGTKTSKKPAGKATTSHADTVRAEAIDHEEAGRWGEAAESWSSVERMADEVEREEAAGRAAAAKVRAQAKSAPLDEALAESPTAAANAESWSAAMPEPGYTPPAGTGEQADAGEDAQVEDDGGDAVEHDEPADVANDARTDTPTTDAATDAATPPDGATTGDTGANAAPTGDGTPARDERMPPVGTVVKKLDRHGKVRCECTIVDGGVEYGGKTYKSLSAAALASARDLGLETKTVDGWAWWGLKTKAMKGATTSKKDPLAGIDGVWQKYLDRAVAAGKGASDEDRAKLHAALGQHVAALQQVVSLVAPAAPTTTGEQA